MLADQCLELADQLAVVAERQLGLVQVLQRGQPQILQAGRLARDERLLAEPRKRRAAPQRERRLERRGGALRVACRELAPALSDEPLEVVRIQPIGIQPQLIAVLAGNDGGAPTIAGAGVERFAQARHVYLQRLRRGRRRMLSPQLVDQPLHRKRLVGVQQEQRQQRPLLVPRGRHVATLIEGLQRTEDAEVHQKERPGPVGANVPDTRAAAKPPAQPCRSGVAEPQRGPVEAGAPVGPRQTPGMDEVRASGGV